MEKTLELRCYYYYGLVGSLYILRRSSRLYLTESADCNIFSVI